MKKAPAIALIVIAVLALIALAAFFLPTGSTGAFPEGWTPVRDDDLATAYMPGILCPARFGSVEAVYYRAARGPDGELHIAYHPVWAYERNEAEGLGPFLSRILYTGGLSLQSLMFGPGDVEVIAVTINAAGELHALDFEGASAYDEKGFAVSHEKLHVDIQTGELPIVEVTSWNHLFTFSPLGDVQGIFQPVYFDEATWQRYGMTKGSTSLLRRDRAHFDWELRLAE